MSERTSSKKVTACPNQSCRLYGIAIDMPIYQRKKFQNGIPCIDCNTLIFPKESFASLKCNSCRKIKNFLHMEIIPKLNSKDPLLCCICGSKNTDITFYVKVEKVSNKIIDTEIITKSKNQSQIFTDKSKKYVKTKSGISLPTPLPEKSETINEPPIKTSEFKNEPAKKKKPFSRSQKTQKFDPTVSIFETEEPYTKNRQKNVKTTRNTDTPDYPWKNQQKSSGIVKPKDEFEVQGRKCAECGVAIPISTLQARPDTKYCLKHIEKAGRFVPVNEGIMSREGARQMRGKDRSLAQQTKKVL